MIGWITLGHVFVPGTDADINEANSIGVYVEPAVLGEVHVGFEMVGARAYEIEAATLQAFSDPRFDQVQWWADDATAWEYLCGQMPLLARHFKKVLCSDGLFDVIGYTTTSSDFLRFDRPLQAAHDSHELFRAIEGAINMLGADVTRRVDALIG